MTWNHRVFREKNGDLVIREVFYENGKVIGCTESAVSPMGETIDELTQDLLWFTKALDQPVMTMEDIPRAYRPILPDGSYNGAGLVSRYPFDKEDHEV